MLVFWLIFQEYGLLGIRILYELQKTREALAGPKQFELCLTVSETLILSFNFCLSSFTFLSYILHAFKGLIFKAILFKTKNFYKALAGN